MGRRRVDGYRKLGRTLIETLMPKSFVPGLMFLTARDTAGLLREYGYGDSLSQHEPRDEGGLFIPWMPYAVIDFLKARLPATSVVLEFGAGFSTLFFMDRAAGVVSIEHDEVWLESLAARVNRNVKLVCRPAGSALHYSQANGISSTFYDLVVIDGLYRMECASTAVDVLHDGGVILLDDSERSEYLTIFQLLERRGFRALTFKGHKFGSIHLHAATVFYRASNCLGI